MLIFLKQKLGCLALFRKFSTLHEVFIQTPVLVFYCYHTKLSQSCHLIICRSEVIHTGSTGLKARHCEGCIPFWRLQGRICFLAHLSCQQNLVFCTAGPYFLAGCQQRVVPSFQRSPTFLASLLSLSSKPSVACQVLLMFKFLFLLLWFVSLIQPGKILQF